MFASRKIKNSHDYKTGNCNLSSSELLKFIYSNSINKKIKRFSRQADNKSSRTGRAISINFHRQKLISNFDDFF